MPHLTRRIPAVLLCCLLLAACTDNALRNAATAIKGTATANKTLVQTVIAENAAGNISNADTKVILDAANKMADAVIVAAKMTKNYTEFAPNQRPALRAVLAPIVTAVKAALNANITGIKNPTLKANITTALLAIQDALAVAETALGGN